MTEQLQQRLGYRFKNASLLAEALTHPSASTAKQANYQRLEFLGDRVLGLVVATMLIERFPGESEGDLAKRHARLVSREMAAKAAAMLDLGPVIKFSKGEADAGGAESASALGDAMESVLGAIYRDGGFEPAMALVRSLWEPMLAENAAPPMDAKTALQEWSQSKGLGLPVYQLVSTGGPAHEPSFTILASVGGHKAGGSGGSKRAAEQAAAKALLIQVEKA